MKILIIEDNERKLKDTIEYVQNVCKEEAEIEVAYSVTEGRRMLKDFIYDRVIIDMQLPSTRNSSIDRFGGITILKYLPMTCNADTRHIVNSSSDETREVLDNNNFPLVGLIVNSSMYNCTKQFDLFINGLKFVEEPIAVDVKETKVEISLTSPITMKDHIQTQVEMGVAIAGIVAGALPVVESIFDNNDNTRELEVGAKATFQGTLVGKADIEPIDSNEYVSGDNNE